MSIENPQNSFETPELLAQRLFGEAKLFIEQNGFNDSAREKVNAWKLAAEAYADEVSDADKAERERRQIQMNFDLAELYEVAFGADVALEIFTEWDMSAFDGHSDLLQQYHERRAALELKVSWGGK